MVVVSLLLPFLFLKNRNGVPMDLKEQHILGKEVSAHWYYRAKAGALAGLPGDWNPASILDVGAGSGFFSRYLLMNSGASEAWCVDTSYTADTDGSVGGKPIHFRRSIGPVDADLLLFMDVLEHVDRDVELLAAYLDKAPSVSRIVISVPAFPFLWSGHDVFLGHRRRYTLNGLERRVESAGLKIRQANYYFAAVFPLAAAVRLAGRCFPGNRAVAGSQLKSHHPVVNTLLAGLCDLEIPLMKVNRLAGLTVFCMAEKAG